MKTILIVGCGNIGYRHLQSVLKLKNLKIDVYDINKKILFNVKKNISKEYKKNQNTIDYIKDFNLLKNSYDICIVATSSQEREKIILMLLKKIKIKYFILEKFLFQSVKSYNNIIKKFEKKRIKAWVNCTRRTMDSYKKLFKNLKNEKFKLTVQSNKLGLACNSIHFLDLFCFFSKSTNLLTYQNNLYNRLYKSKRKNYIEFKGELIIKNNKGNILKISDKNVHDKNIIKTIENKFMKIVINESENKCLYFDKKKSVKKNLKFIYEFNSNLTKIYIADIINKKNCDLPELKYSSKLHIFLLKIFLKQYKKVKKYKIINLNIT